MGRTLLPGLNPLAKFRPERALLPPECPSCLLALALCLAPAVPALPVLHCQASGLRVTAVSSCRASLPTEIQLVRQHPPGESDYCGGLRSGVAFLLLFSPHLKMHLACFFCSVLACSCFWVVLLYAVQQRHLPCCACWEAGPSDCQWSAEQAPAVLQPMLLLLSLNSSLLLHHWWQAWLIVHALTGAWIHQAPWHGVVPGNPNGAAPPTMCCQYHHAHTAVFSPSSSADF